MTDFQAAAFLGALTGSDGWETAVTFQTFDDRAEKDARLARILHGSLRRHQEALRGLNERGAGIFVTVQETDGRGRREENIVGLRACFIDCDGPRKQRLALPASIVVRTARGGHVYWLLDGGAERSRFRCMQQRLATYFGSDRTVCDLARVMRVPGFTHNKTAPARVELVAADVGRRYTLDVLATAHPIPADDGTRTRLLARCMGDYEAWSMALRTMPGRRNSTAFALAAEGFRRGNTFSRVAAVVEAYCARAGIEEEAPAVVSSAYTYVRRRS